MREPWNAIGNGFCEKRIWGLPEYVNSITSLFFCFCSFHILFQNKKLNSIIIWILSTMFLVGLGSFGYHFWGWNVMSHMDVNPMFFALWILNYNVWDSVFFKFFVLKRKWEKIFKKFRFINALFIQTGFFLTIALRQVSGVSLNFNDYFIYPAIFVLIGFLVMRIFTHKENFNNNKIHNIYFYWAFVDIVLAGVFRLALSEPNCFDNPWMRYTFAHGFWHLFIAHAFYLAITNNIYIYYSNNNMNPFFKHYTFFWNSNCMVSVDRVFTYLFPVIDCAVNVEALYQLRITRL